MDDMHVKGADGIIRSLSEHYDAQRDVEQDPYGAWLAIQNQATRIEALEARIAKADALADAFEDFNAKIDKARAPVGSARIATIEALAAYREGSDT